MAQKGSEPVAEENEYTVEKILKACVFTTGPNNSKKLWKYRVKWQGYSNEENSWEPAESFVESEEMIDEFWGHVGMVPRPKASQYSFLEEIVPDDYVEESARQMRTKPLPPTSLRNSRKRKTADPATPASKRKRNNLSKPTASKSAPKATSKRAPNPKSRSKKRAATPKPKEPTPMPQATGYNSEMDAEGETVTDIVETRSDPGELDPSFSISFSQSQSQSLTQWQPDFQPPPLPLNGHDHSEPLSAIEIGTNAQTDATKTATTSASASGSAGSNVHVRAHRVPAAAIFAGNFDLYDMSLPFLKDAFLGTGLARAMPLPNYQALYDEMISYQLRNDYTAQFYLAAAHNNDTGAPSQMKARGIMDEKERPRDIRLLDLREVDHVVFEGSERGFFHCMEDIPDGMGVVGETSTSGGGGQGIFKLTRAWVELEEGEGEAEGAAESGLPVKGKSTRPKEVFEGYFKFGFPGGGKVHQFAFWAVRARVERRREIGLVKNVPPPS